MRLSIYLYTMLSISILTQTLSAQNTNITTIRNKHIKAGFLPDVGGRMVYFAPVDGENFLFSDSTFWNEPENKRIKPSPTAPFKPYNGLITWVGPQSQWWTHQNLVPAKKERADVWPPDPYLIYSDFEILEKTDTSIVMECGCSPISGVKLIKKFILDKNELLIEHTAINCRDTVISWDLWSNARFDAFTTFKVPVNNESIQKIQAEENNQKEIIKHKIESGYFTFEPELPVDNRKQRIAKAFIYPTEGKMIVEKNVHILTIGFDMVPKSDIHPEQALIEVYNCVTYNGVNNILELEHHSAYQSITPRKSITLKEKWLINRTINAH